MSPRPRQFNREDALDRAKDLFWKEGYEATSLADLLEAMNLNRQSLYNTFGDKRGLYLAALKRYRTVDAEPLLSALEKPGVSLKELRLYFVSLADLFATKPRRGCMMVLAAQELAHRDRDVDTATRKYFDRLNAVFHRLLTTAKKRGELSVEKDPRVLARTLIVFYSGIAVLARTGISRKSLREIATQSLRPLT